MSPLGDDDVHEILRIIDEEGPAEVRVESRGLKIHIVRDGGAGAVVPRQVEGPSASGSGPDKPVGARPPRPARLTEAPARSSSAVAVAAPMMGVFYVAEAPGKPPFVQVGDRVEPASVVGIVEVMKMMNSVEAGVAGTVVEVCVGNAEMVEEGQALVMVEPA
ncbi:MAG TPA: biotin/lipoyl-containing protein [Solirubrobacteraceae bacterium]|nr:biotin/lipoyl-containing protein [Solirubrobacteraceae bacterium]